MTDLEYTNAANALFLQVESLCDQVSEQSDVDLDTQRSGGVLTLTFMGAGKQQVVINLQRPLQEVWLASRNGGHHYKCNPAGQWTDTKTGQEFFSDFKAILSSLTGVAVDQLGA